MSVKSTIIVVIIIFVLAGAALVLGSFWVLEPEDGRGGVENFEECVAAGYPVMESYPRRCSTPDGTTFTEDIGNALEVDNLIRVDSPRPNARIASPFVLSGSARGTWYFEADFPVELYDGNGELLLSTSTQAQGEWMTEEFVPFEKEVRFEEPETETGLLILHKSNPSGLPENANELRVPVRFERTAE